MFYHVLILFAVTFPFLAALTMWFSKERILNSFAALTSILVFSVILYLSFLNVSFRFTPIELNRYLKITFTADPPALLFATMASFLWIFTVFYSMGYIEPGASQKRFFTFMIGCLGITMGIAFAGNLFTFYVFYELLTFATYPLVIHHQKSESFDAGKKYLVYSLSGASLVLLGIIAVFWVSETLAFVPGGILNLNLFSPNLGRIIFFAFFLGFGVKAAIVPLHSWLPSAMVAPTPVSALFHAVAVVKSGIFAIFRLMFYVFTPELIKELGLQISILWMASLTIIFGSFMALYQHNLKKRLAYSTISQLSYIILGLALFTSNGLKGALLHLVNHALLKITLFFCAGSIIIKAGLKEVEDMVGIGKKMPLTMTCFTLASIGLVGIPPTNGFVSKWFLSIGSLEAEEVVFIIVLLFSALLTAGYLLPISVRGFFSGEHSPEQHENLDPPLTMLIPMLILTGLTLYLGFYPNLPLLLIEQTLDLIL